MYVGDDEAVEHATSLRPEHFKLAGIACLIGAALSKKHRTALAAGGALSLVLASGIWTA